MVNQFSYPDHPFNQAGIRPQPLTQGDANKNQPLLPLLNAYPKKDGSPMQFDAAKLLADPAYNEQYLTDFVTNRDDRFYATIFTGGTPYPTPDLPTGTGTGVHGGKQQMLRHLVVSNMFRSPATRNPLQSAPVFQGSSVSKGLTIPSPARSSAMRRPTGWKYVSRKC